MGNTNSSLLIASALCLTLLGSQANAAKNDLGYLSLSLEELGQITISIATGSETPIDKAPAVATVITAEQIEAMGARTLDEVLETVPGLHVSLSDNRLDFIYSIRGIHTSFNPQVLMLINGFPVQWPGQGGRPLLFRQPIHNISRVEVIRGPGSAIYGADAFSGVINVITKTADEITGTEFGTQIGSFDYYEAWLQTSKVLDNWSYAYSFNYQHSNGDDSRTIDADLQTLFDTIYGTSASLAPGPLSTGYEIIDSQLNLQSDQWNINFHAWISRDTGNGAGGLLALDPSSSDNYQLYRLDTTYKTSDWAEYWSNSFRFNYSYFDLDANFTLLPPNTEFDLGPDGNIGITNFDNSDNVEFPDGLIGNPDAKTQDAQLDFISIYEGFDNHRFRIGIGSRYQSLKTTETKNFGPGVITDLSVDTVTGELTDVTDTENVYAENTSRTINYISLQDEWDIDSDWLIISGVRYDRYSDFGSTTNPRVALIWQTNPKLSTKLLYGSAFRAPSFAELGFQNNPRFIGNSDLDPEKIDTFELSFSHTPSDRLQTTTSLFSYRAADLIEFTPDASAGGDKANNNSSDQEGHGIEFEFNWKLNERLRIDGNYSWQNSKDKDTNTTIADAPGQQITLKAFWKPTKNWLISGKVNWVAERERAPDDSRDDISDYIITDLTLRRNNIYKNLSLSFGIRNLFNEKAFEPSSFSINAPPSAIPGDFPLEQRSYWLEANYIF